MRQVNVPSEQGVIEVFEYSFQKYFKNNLIQTEAAVQRCFTK